jgi:2'-5' RNA ligase
MRLFVACNLPAAVRLAVEAHTAPLRQTLRSGSWVRSDALHVTLAFIGEQSETVIPAIDAHLRESLSSTVRIQVEIQGAGVFPNERRARVGWLALQPESRVTTIADQVRSALVAARVPFDAKPFRSHITLVRFRDGARPDVARQFIDHFNQLRSEPFAIDEVTLYASTLSSRGAVHTPLSRIALR